MVFSLRELIRYFRLRRIKKSSEPCKRFMKTGTLFLHPHNGASGFNKARGASYVVHVPLSEADSVCVCLQVAVSKGHFAHLSMIQQRSPYAPTSFKVDNVLPVTVAIFRMSQAQRESLHVCIFCVENAPTPFVAMHTYA